MSEITKKLNLELEGLDGNAFSLLGAFRRQAKLEGWTKEEIEKVHNEATSSDYDNLVAVLFNYCEPMEDNYESDIN